MSLACVLRNNWRWHEICRERERERERETPMLIEHRHYSAKARCSKRGSLLQVDYTGPVTLDSIDYLEGMVLPSRRSMGASIDRLDTAIVLFAGPVRVSSENYPDWIPPSAVIVPHDQMQRSREFCELLWKVGVLRTAWYPEHIDHARRWCDAVGMGSWRGLPPQALRP